MLFRMFEAFASIANLINLCTGIDIQEPPLFCGATHSGDRFPFADDDRWIKILDHIAQDLTMQADVERRRHGANPAGAEEGPDEFDTIGAQNRNPISFPKAKSMQRRSECAGSVHQLFSRVIFAIGKADRGSIAAKRYGLHERTEQSSIVHPSTRCRSWEICNLMSQRLRDKANAGPHSARVPPGPPHQRSSRGPSCKR